MLFTLINDRIVLIDKAFSIVMILRWKNVGESLLAMYRHQTTCEPPRPSLGRRIDLSQYRDPNCLRALPPEPCPPVSDIQTIPSSSPSSSLPPLPVPEPSALSQPSPLVQITQSQTVEVTTTTAPSVGQLFLFIVFSMSIPLICKHLDNKTNCLRMAYCML